MASPPVAGKDEGSEVAPIVLEDFGSLNTKAKRPAIQPNEFSWNENWMPIGPGNMRTMFAEGATLYTATGGKTIIYKLPFNFGSTSYIALFLSDGSAVQVRNSDGAVTTIGAAGTFWTTGGDLPVACQWQSKYLLIGSTKTANSYWVWDGTSLYTAGTLAPQVTITDSGGTYASAPTVTAYVNGSVSSATFTATVTNNAVSNITVTNPGSGLAFNDHVQLVITGGGSDDQARATATVSSTAGVAVVNVLSGGTGYTALSVVTFSGGAGTGAEAVISGLVNGVITEITVTHTGTGYTSAPTAAVSVGSGATFSVEIVRGQVTAITVDSGGTGYTGAPTVTISAPDDVTFPVIQAEANALVSGGAVTSITVTNPGIGYINAGVEILNGNDAANASVTLMPFGIQATSIETYQNIVWTSVGTKMSQTAPGSVSNFSTAAGGGSEPASDSFLRRQIVALRQANGFLYRFGDSSINVISNVQTSTTGTTTFNNSNVDPQVGTAWRDSIASFGRALVFANSSGVYALYGGAAEKVSQPLDGLFAAASFNTGVAGITPTAAVATIFGIRVYILLFTTTDPYTHTLRNVMAVWDGQKWFCASQLKTPTVISVQEIDSVLTAWATDGTRLFPMFQTASASLSKVFQTKLAAGGGYHLFKQVNRVYFMAQTNTSDIASVSITMDTEAGSAPTVTTPVFGVLKWTGAGGLPITWTGAGGASLEFAVSNLVIEGYNEAAYGRLIGATVLTNSVDLTLISMTLLAREYATFG